MVVTDPEGEVESPLQSDEHQNNHSLSSLGRQSSIYSLTLDEFQHALYGSGKDFGSMNMDEFLTSIWNAEENNQIPFPSATTTPNQLNHALNSNFSGSNTAISKQPSLPRQGSLSLPAPLCSKTVDEVWSEINRRQLPGSTSNGNNADVHHPDQRAPRQATLGEMTLEDFLIKAGVVREQDANSAAISAGFTSKTVLGGGGSSGGGAVGYPIPPSQGGGGIGDSTGRNGGFGGGYAPSSMATTPVPPEAMVNNGADNQFGFDMGGLRGRKRNMDGPVVVEKVVERRQRRMIKNRESAARSRARKQEYTVELEAELNQLKEENNQLRHALAELERKRKQQYLDEKRMKAHTRVQKDKDKLRMMRRNLSSPC